MQSISMLVGFENESHAVVEMFEKHSALMILFLAVIVAPVLEELLFRAPLALFKESKFFKYAF